MYQSYLIDKGVIMKLTVKKIITKSQITSIVSDESTSKSFKMRELFNGGLDVKEISNLLHVRYNFVYNIISRHCLEQRISESQIEKHSNKGSELKSTIENLIGENPDIKVSEVSKQLGKNYNYVWKIMKEIKG